MNSYKKLAKQRDDTEFELKIIHRWILDNGNNPVTKLMHEKLKGLFKTYEIE